MYSKIKYPKTCNWSVKIAIPVNNKRTPPTFVIIDKYFLILLENIKNLSIKIPEIIKGNASPNEYEESNIMLSLIFASTTAIVKIDPRIGPMQGVHPKPNAEPTKNGKKKLLLYFSVRNLDSLFIKFKFKNPKICSEKIIIIIPAIILKMFELFKNIFPINDALSPMPIKTKEKPKVKNIVLNTTKLLLFLDKLLYVVPEIYEI